ncbi:MAG: hypothetical protein WC536_02645 [Patescibacteria group bacterium]
MKEASGSSQRHTRVFRADSEEVGKHADEICELVGPNIESDRRDRMSSATAVLIRVVSG